MHKLLPNLLSCSLPCIRTYRDPGSTEPLLCEASRQHHWVHVHWASSPSRLAHQPHSKPQPRLRPASGGGRVPPDWSFPRHPPAGAFWGWHGPTTQKQGPAVQADLIWSSVSIAECSLPSEVLPSLHLVPGRSKQGWRRRSNIIAFIFTYGNLRYRCKTDLKCNFLTIFLA